MPIRKLHFPVGGLHRRYGYQTQPPFTSADCLNVRPFDPQEGRERGGSRPGLATVFDEPIPGGATDLFTVDVVPVPESVQLTWLDSFDGSVLSDVWQVVEEDYTPVVANGYLYFSSNGTLIRSQIDDFDDVKPHTIKLGVSQYQGRYRVRYDLWAAVSDPLDLRKQAIRMAVELYQDAPHQMMHRLYMWKWVNGEAQQLAGLDVSDIDELNPTDTFTMELLLDFVAGTVTYQMRSASGMVVHPVTLVADLPFTGKYSGFSVYPATADPALVTDFAQHYTALTDPFFDKPRPVLAAVGSDGKLRSNRDPGVMSEAIHQPEFGDDPLLLSQNTPKSGAAFLTMLYIADPVNGPMVFDPAKNHIGPWETELYTSGPDEDSPKGTVPQGCHLLARYVGRMVLAGKPEHAFYQSRAGNPLDFDYDRPIDIGRAVNGQAVPEWGALSGALTALVSFSDDYLLFGQRDSIARQVGDLHAGGRIVNVSQAVGILDRFAWCVTPESELVFMGSDGLFSLAPGGASFPVPISREVLPSELIGIEPLNNRIILVYDHVGVGVHIFIVPIAGGGTQHWWFDWRTRGFSPISLHGDHTPHAAVWYDGDGITPPGVILACRDGYLAGFSEASETDRGVAFPSYCDYGPVRLAPVDSKTGVLNSIRVFNPATSGKVNIEARVGGSAEEAFGAPVVHSEEADGRAIRVKRGGSAAYIRVSGTGRAWQMENVEVDVATVGPAKPL